jgi:hypothetical protein
MTKLNQNPNSDSDSLTMIDFVRPLNYIYSSKNLYYLNFIEDEDASIRLRRLKQK